jgi:hypothetical protein
LLEFIEFVGFVEFRTRIWVKKWVRRRWGEELIGGFSSPHTLLPKEEKEEKIVTCDVVSAKKVPLNGNGFSFR